MKHPRLYVPLDVGYSRDPKIRRAGTAAELLFVRALAYVKDAETDGLVPEDDLPAIGVRLPDPRAAVNALVREGVLERVDGGWRIVAWHVWNEPQSAIDRRRQLARERQARKRSRDSAVTRDITHTSRACHAPQAEAEAEAEDTPGEVGDADPHRTGLALVDRLDIERACQHLADWIERNGSRRPKITKTWRNDARLLLDADGRTEEQVHAAIDWCQQHEFWRVHVMSMGKLRGKYDEMRLDAQRQRRPRSGPSHDDKVRGWLELGNSTEAIA